MNNSGNKEQVFFEEKTGNQSANADVMETLALEISRKQEDSLDGEFPKAPEIEAQERANSESLRGIVEAGALLIKDGPKQFTVDLPSGERLLFSLKRNGVRAWALSDQSGQEIANSDITPEMGKKQLLNFASIEATHVVVDKFWGFYDEHWSIDYRNSDRIEIDFVFGPQHKTKVHLRRTTAIGEVDYDFKFRLGDYTTK